MNIARNLKRYIQIAAISIGATLSAPTIAMPVLVGSTTLNATDDLTVIQNGAQALQFLDLTVRQGNTVANALASFGASGFTWATGAEVAQLYAAFGITYPSAPNQAIDLNAQVGNAANLNAYLGITIFDASLGWIDTNIRLPGFTFDLHTHACISETGCTPNSFVGSVHFPWPSALEIGVYLVRQAPIAVPEPESFALLAFGLVAPVSSVRPKRGGMSPQALNL